MADDSLTLIVQPPHAANIIIDAHPRAKTNAKTNANVFVEIFIIILRETEIREDYIRRLVDIISMDKRDADLNNTHHLHTTTQFNLLSGSLSEDSIKRIFLVQRIWQAISLKMESKLNTMIIDTQFPHNYETLKSNKKWRYVKHILDYLNNIQLNLIILMSFFTSTVRGLITAYDNIVRTRDDSDKNVLLRKWPLDKLNNYTTELMDYLTSELQRWSIDYLEQHSVRKGGVLPEMCFYGDTCTKKDNLHHIRYFLHPTDTYYWLVDLKDHIKPGKLVRTNEPSFKGPKAPPGYGGEKKRTRPRYSKRRTHRRTRTRRRITRRRR
jgi:hypothetical protein